MEQTEQDMKISADNVRRLRVERGWSQEQLATASGLGLRTIQRVEAEGRAARETRVCLAATFGVELAELSATPVIEGADQTIPGLKRYKIALAVAGVAMVPVLLNAAGIIASNILVSGCLFAAIFLGLYGGFGAYFTGAPRHPSRIKRYAQVTFIAFAIFSGFAAAAENREGLVVSLQILVLVLGVYFLQDALRSRRPLGK